MQENCFAEVEFCCDVLFLRFCDEVAELGGDPDKSEWVAGIGSGGEDVEGGERESEGLRGTAGHRWIGV